MEANSQLCVRVRMKIFSYMPGLQNCAFEASGLRKLLENILHQNEDIDPKKNI